VPDTLTARLEAFRTVNSFTGKGALALALVVTRHARAHGLPLNSKVLITEKRGQVLGLGKGAVQRILKEHGISRTLAKEGGRTSRGSLGNMERYVTFLNELHADGLADLEAIEKWWAARVEEFFAAKRLAFTYDTSKSLRYAIDDLFDQAARRQREATGTTIVGTVLQHLVGAKLSLMLSDDAIIHHGASVADESSSRAGDFAVEDVCVHVSARPNESLIEKCRENLNEGLRPIIVTTIEALAGVHSLASLQSIGDRIDIFEVGQFLSTNFYEWSRFKPVDRKISIDRLVEKYNEIVAEYETDPSLQIKVARPKRSIPVAET
jgi:hypothetical protein